MLHFKKSPDSKRGIGYLPLCTIPNVQFLSHLGIKEKMKEHIHDVAHKLVSPSLRYEARSILAWLQEQLSRACFWSWEITRLPQPGGNPYDIIYIGRKSQRKLAKALLIAHREDAISPTEGCKLARTVFVSEMPFPGALRVPALLSSVVPLGRPIDEITANYHSQLRRELRKNRARYRLQQVLDSAGIEHADSEMLRPYARARHGIGASQIELDEVKRMAQNYGRLDLLLLDDEVVGCQTGNVITRAGKRYWSTNRCGYPEAVFSDPKRLRDCNSFNIYLALEYANENGFDYYDIGVSLGRPGDGLLEWKRRRGSELDTMGNSCYFHIRLPSVGVAQFLWDAPLFAIERQNLTLHLGLPVGPSDEEVTNRYREMGFGGLRKVYLHCARAPSAQLIETLHSFYAHQKSPPLLEIIPST
jgi:hypothetical protein